MTTTATNTSLNGTVTNTSHDPTITAVSFTPTSRDHTSQLSRSSADTIQSRISDELSRLSLTSKASGSITTGGRPRESPFASAGSGTAASPSNSSRPPNSTCKTPHSIASGTASFPTSCSGTSKRRPNTAKSRRLARRRSRLASRASGTGTSNTARSALSERRSGTATSRNPSRSVMSGISGNSAVSSTPINTSYATVSNDWTDDKSLKRGLSKSNASASRGWQRRKDFSQDTRSGTAAQSSTFSGTAASPVETGDVSRKARSAKKRRRKGRGTSNMGTSMGTPGNVTAGSV